ncbi:MAG TPA: hypothetical protein VK530_03585, partial [Candidatus Acidoferrum sp.]|nr:hypothetical protein [Candidatus Acidoferrum sp.]
MKKFLFGIFTVLAGVNAAFAAASAIYINNSPVNFGNIPPQIDAEAFLNRSIFEVSPASLP